MNISAPCAVETWKRMPGMSLDMVADQLMDKPTDVVAATMED
jgi:hypothetical protein